MKKFISIFTVLVISLFLSIPVSNATEPGEPPGGPGTGEEPIGGGAPIGGGTFILIALGAAYGGKKIYNYRKKESDCLNDEMN